MSAWVSISLLLSTGPIKTSASYATALESFVIGYEMIREGKTRVRYVDGFNNFREKAPTNPPPI